MPVIPYNGASFESVLAALQAYVKSKPDSQRWTDFYASSAGETLMELMAGFGAFLSFQSNASAVESKIDQAKLRSSIYLIASMLGYHINRVTAPILSLSVTGAVGVSLNRFTSIGTVGSYNIASTRDVTLESPDVIEAVVGTWKVFQKEFALSQDFMRVHIEDLKISNGVDQFVAWIDRGGSRIDLKLTQNPEDMIPVPGWTSYQILSGVSLTDPISSDDYGVIPNTFLLPIEFIRRGSVKITIRDLSTGQVVDTLVDVRGPYEFIGSPKGWLLGNSSAGWIDYASGQYRIYDFSIVSHETATNRIPNFDTHLFSIDVVYQAIRSFRFSDPFNTVLMRTYFDGVMLYFGDSVFGFRPQIGDIVNLEYFETEGPIFIGGERVSSLNLTDVNLSVAGATLTDVLIDRQGAFEDPLEKIRAVAPGFHAAQRRMVTEEDHRVVVLGYSGTMVSAQVRRKEFGTSKIYPTEVDMLADTNAIDLTTVGSGMLRIIPTVGYRNEMMNLSELPVRVDIVADKIAFDRNIISQGEVTLSKASPSTVLPAPLAESVGYWVKAPEPISRCCTVDIVYLFDDGHLLGSGESYDLDQYVGEYKMVGENVEFLDPVPLYLLPTLTVVVEPGFDVATIKQAILDAYDRQTMQLGVPYKVGEALDDIAEIPGIRRVYAVRPVSDKVLNFGEYVAPMKEGYLSLTVLNNLDSNVTIVPDDLAWSYIPPP